MNNYISKPFTQEQLATTLTRWLPKSTQPDHVQGTDATTNPEVPHGKNTAAPTATKAGLLPQVISVQGPAKVILNLAALAPIRALPRLGTPSVLRRIIPSYLETSSRLLQTARVPIMATDASTSSTF